MKNSRVSTAILFGVGFGLVLGAGKAADWLFGFARWIGVGNPAGNPGPQHLLEYGLEHLGAVVVVALLLRATLEHASQREFMNLVSQEVKEQISLTTKEVAQNSIKPLEDDIRKLTTGLTYRISNLFDAKLQKVLEESVLNPTFIRPDYSLRMKLRPMPEASDPGLLEVRLEVSYSVRNITPKPHPYMIEFWLDDIVGSSAGRCRFTRVSFGEDAVPLLAVDLSDLEERKQIVRHKGTLSLQLNTGLIQPYESRRVEVQAFQPMRNIENLVWNMAGLTQSLHIEIELLDGLTFDNFDVIPREMHHCGHDVFLGSAEKTGNTKLQMKIDQVLLPYQGVQFQWSSHAGSTLPAKAFPAKT